MAYVKPHQKANFFKRCALVSLCYGLSACADSTILNVLIGEPAAGTMANRAGILRVDSHEAVWPNLASVPARPINVPAQIVRDAQKDQLEGQRTAGLAILDAHQSATSVVIPAPTHTAVVKIINAPTAPAASAP